MAFGKYKTYEAHCKANTEKILHHHVLDEVRAEKQASGARYGEPFLREDFELQFFNGQPRYEGRFSRWLADHEFYDEVSESIHIKNPSIVIPVKGKKSLVNWKADLTAYEMEFNGRVNDFGKTLSQLEDFRLAYANYLRSEDGQALLRKLKKEGYDTPELTALSMGKAGGIMGVWNTEDGQALDCDRNLEFMLQMAAFEDSADINGLSKQPDLAYTLTRSRAFGEETTHLFRDAKVYGIVGLIKEELATKKSLKKFYKERAKGAGKNDKMRLENELLVEMMEKDIADVPQNYLVPYLTRDLGYSNAKATASVQKYLALAKAQGLEGEDAMQYVVEQIEAEQAKESKDTSAALKTAKKSKEQNTGTKDAEPKTDSEDAAPEESSESSESSE